MPRYPAPLCRLHRCRYAAPPAGQPSRRQQTWRSRRVDFGQGSAGAKVKRAVDHELTLSTLSH
ncbi:MAG: hypothetical protein MZU84_01160 [Sphingobacterium sp.]|nr:hypothetical protein [Sphingobacterium sp.]